MTDFTVFLSTQMQTLSIINVIKTFKNCHATKALTSTVKFSMIVNVVFKT